MNKPNEADWMKVGNDFLTAINHMRNVLGLSPLPLHEKPCGLPTQELLDEYERMFPGSKSRLIDMAYDEMRHRKEMEQILKQ